MVVSNFNIIDVIVLAVKPQNIENVLLELKPFSNRIKLIISIIAGIKINKYEKCLGKTIPIIRAMPNTPASEGEGITAIVRNKICKFSFKCAYFKNFNFFVFKVIFKTSK